MIAALVLTISSIAITALIGLYMFRYVTSEPNEWMLVLRNGKVIRSGIGISGFISFGDRVVKFPSKINKVKFSAQQVTNEMQGIEVSGVIIWAIYRESDGPARAYKNLGEDLKQPEPHSANSSLVEMANSIVRHRIANSSIEEIIKKRSKVREEVKKEMNAVVNGWGVWLETVEITDVKILSSSLFKNLQTEFREEQRQNAELIRMRIENSLEEKRLAQQLEISKKKSENETKQSIYKLNEELKVKEEQQFIYKKDQEIQQQRIDSEQLLKIHKLEKDNQYKEEANTQAHQQKLNKLALDSIQELKKRELTVIHEETVSQELEADLNRNTLRKEAELEAMRQGMEMRNNIYKDTPYQYHAMNTIKDIYSSLPLTEVKVLNMNGDSKDSVGSLVANIVTAVKEV